MAIKILLVLALMLTGCASMVNTPQQDRVWAAYNQCQAEGRIANNIQMIRVEPDGRYWWQWSGGTHGSVAIQECITEKVSR